MTSCSSGTEHLLSPHSNAWTGWSPARFSTCPQCPWRWWRGWSYWWQGWQWYKPVAFLHRALTLAVSGLTVDHLDAILFSVHGNDLVEKNVAKVGDEDDDDTWLQNSRPLSVWRIAGGCQMMSKILLFARTVVFADLFSLASRNVNFVRWSWPCNMNLKVPYSVSSGHDWRSM